MLNNHSLIKMPFRSKKADAWNDSETPAAATDDHHGDLTTSLDRKLSNVSTVDGAADHSHDVANNSSACPTGEDIQVNNAIPSQNILKKIEDYPVLDVDGKSIPFKAIYTGPNVARRVLIIFVRHFYCGVSYASL